MDCVCYIGGWFFGLGFFVLVWGFWVGWFGFGVCFGLILEIS